MMSAAWANNSHAAKRNRLVTVAFGAAVLLFVLFIFHHWDELPRVPDHLRHFSSGGCAYPQPDGIGRRLIYTDSDLNSLLNSGGSSSKEDASAEKANLQQEPSPTSIQPVTVTVTQSVTATATVKAKRPDGCVDPYRRPGYMSFDKSHDYNETRYIPYNDAFHNAEPPANAIYPYDPEIDGELWFDSKSHVEQSWLDKPSTPVQWLNMAVTEARGITHQNKTISDKLKWLNGRVVLAISDSVDRFNMQWFCDEFREREADPEAKWTTSKQTHNWAICRVPSINVTLVHWHLAGMVPYYPSWWWDKGGADIVPFEERWDSVWNATFKDVVSINGKGPDLVLWQTALWDRKNYVRAGSDHYPANNTKQDMGSYERPLVWSEVRFHAARVKTFLQMLRDRMGKEVPIMLRSATIDRYKPAKDLQIYEIDRINRAVNTKFGNEVFEWAKIVTGHTELYLDLMHLGRGASSWLWGTMALEYLARAVGAGTAGGARPERTPYFEGWQACHEWML